MKKNGAYALGFVLFALAAGYLCYAGFTENGAYFLNVAEARSVQPETLKQARLFGLVADSGINKNGNNLAFNLVDKDDANLVIPVVYVGLTPDAFKGGAEVIVEGGMEPSGRFRANSLMTKCPSKYQKANRAI